MGITYSSSLFEINGVIDTSKPVFPNIDLLSTACGVWVTYDIHKGKWAVVINKADDAVVHFDDDNIMGSINVTSTPIHELYNSVEVQIPHIDIEEQSDFVRISIPEADMFPTEVENTLTINMPLTSDPVQAQVVGMIELKQSRLDKVVTFNADYSTLNVQAGDIFTLSNSIYGFSNKKFRVTRFQEIEDDSGIYVNIIGQEYDDQLYDFSDISRYQRSNSNGIIAIGALGKPGTPQVTKTELDTRPKITISSTIPDNTDPNNPAGIATGMEFWLYTIPGSELPTWGIVDDDTRTYKLHSTVAPSAGKKVFEPGEEVILVIDDIDPGNFLVKTRAINSTTTGEYSNKSGLVTYEPQQITNVINENTKSMSNGEVLLTTIGTGLAMKLLSDYLGDGLKDLAEIVGLDIFEKAPQSMESKLVDAQYVYDNLVAQGAMYCMFESQNDGITWAVHATPDETLALSKTFTPWCSSRCQINIVLDGNFNVSGGNLNGRTNDSMAMGATITDLETNTVVGSKGTTKWAAFDSDDVNLSFLCDTFAGKQYRLDIYSQSESEGGAGVNNVDVNILVHTTGPTSI